MASPRRAVEERPRTVVGTTDDAARRRDEYREAELRDQHRHGQIDRVGHVDEETLLDRFAAAALPALIDPTVVYAGYEAIAQEAYGIGAAMLAVREGYVSRSPWCTECTSLGTIFCARCDAFHCGDHANHKAKPATKAAP